MFSDWIRNLTTLKARCKCAQNHAFYTNANVFLLFTHSVIMQYVSIHTVQCARNKCNPDISRYSLNMECMLISHVKGPKRHKRQKKRKCNHSSVQPFITHVKKWALRYMQKKTKKTKGLKFHLKWQCKENISRSHFTPKSIEK